jgi:hypothetical protein
MAEARETTHRSRHHLRRVRRGTTQDRPTPNRMATVRRPRVPARRLPAPRPQPQQPASRPHRMQLATVQPSPPRPPRSDRRHAATLATPHHRYLDDDITPLVRPRTRTRMVNNPNFFRTRTMTRACCGISLPAVVRRVSPVTCRWLSGGSGWFPLTDRKSRRIRPDCARI